MRTKSLLIVLVAMSLGASATLAAGTKDYQVTGPVLEVNDTMVAVQKGKERWEIARDANTKTTGDVKVGDKVTVHYMMTATTIDVKGAGKSGASPSPKKK